MNKILGATIVVLAAVTLAGCSGGADKVEAFHTLVHAIPAYKNMTDADIDKSGKAICSLFTTDAGSAYGLAHDAVVGTGRTEAQAIVFIRGSVAAYCPDHTKDIPADAK